MSRIPFDPALPETDGAPYRQFYPLAACVTSICPTSAASARFRSRKVMSALKPRLRLIKIAESTGQLI